MKQFSDSVSEHLARRQVWEQKYAIRACYGGWYERLKPYIVTGTSLEVGAGTGNFKSFWPELIVSDLIETPYVDLVADGTMLPLAAGSLSNLVVIDLLHHLHDPHKFFDEAARVLKPGGRILIIEPYITLLSYVCYFAVHHEDICFSEYGKSSTKEDPWEGNLAMMNLLFDRQKGRWNRRHPSFHIITRQPFGLLDFQLAGGFKPYAVVGWPALYDLALKLDRALEWLAPLCAFRMFCVIENRAD
ncbi:MAG: class I SAM-dependent methyltransferase [Planctomycetota bacterium]|nr:MAG: class I SAM-dependent methyltransferase [Planctomycetota bacterium]